MMLQNFFATCLLVFTWSPVILAQTVFTAPTKPFTNSTLTTSSIPPEPTVCCFLVQDTVSGNWWQITSYSSSFSTVNLTSITTFITKYPNATSTNYETNVYPTGVTQSWTYKQGWNSLANEPNYGPGPVEVTNVLEGGGAVTTGGVVVKSPSPFYVYNTIKIITAAPVTDNHGIVACGTTSIYTEWNGIINLDHPFHWGIDPNPFSTTPRTLSHINSNAEAYFGGPDFAGYTSIPTATTLSIATWTREILVGTTTSYYEELHTYTDVQYTSFATNHAGSFITPENQTGVVISMTEPFIYVPGRSHTDEYLTCHQSGGTENYGYVPQTLLDYLIAKPEYSSQYPGLEACIPAGPSIVQSPFCTQAVEAGSTVEWVKDLTSTTVVYVTPPKLGNQASSKVVDGGSGDGSTTVLRPTSRPAVPARPTVSALPQAVPTTLRPTASPPPTKVPNLAQSSINPSTQPSSNPQQQPRPQGLGQIINSLFNPPPAPQPQVLTISAATTIPIADLPFFPGLSGLTSTTNGNPVIIVPHPTTLTVLPTAASQLQAHTEVGVQAGPVVISAATTIPIADLPFFPGLVGETITFDNGRVGVVVTAPTTLSSPITSSLLPEDSTLSATSDSGIGELSDESPVLVILRPTTIPLNPAYSIVGSTTVSEGRTFVVVSTPTTVTRDGLGGTTSLVLQGSSDGGGAGGAGETSSTRAVATSTKSSAASRARGVWGRFEVGGIVVLGGLWMVVFS